MNAQTEVKVWDPLVRVFHWTLVAAFFTAYFLDDEEMMDVHVLAGYTVLGLVLVRVVWGFIGTEHALFRDFVRSPVTAVCYAFDALRGTARRYLGHNPAGGAMIVLLLVCLLLLTISGVALYGADQHLGPLAGLFADTGEGEELEEMLEEVHEILANFTLVLIGIHVLGVIVESRLHKESLVLSMITGRKRA